MVLPALLKSPYFIGVAAVVGIAGVSAAILLKNSGRGVDYSESIRENEGQRKNLVSSFALASQLETRCFSNFFGEKDKISTSVVNSINGTIDIAFSTPKNPTDPSSVGVPKGCAYMQFSKKGREAFIFQTETTVKNDRVGLALFSLGRNVQSDHQNTEQLSSRTNNVLTYYLFFLEKEGDDWQVKGGYSWVDSAFSGGFANVTLHLESPNGNISVNESYSGIAAATLYKDGEWTHKMYFGHWVGNGSSGKEVFEKIELWGYDKNHAEILGRDYTKKFVDTKTGRGYGDETLTLAKHEYKVVNGTDDKKWHPRQKLDVATLDNWYAPFKGKKGVWTAKPISYSE